MKRSTSLDLLEMDIQFEEEQMEKDRELAILRKYGKKGGDKTKQIPGHLSRVAKIGGQSVKKKQLALNPNYYKDLNKKSQEAKKLKKLQNLVY